MGPRRRARACRAVKEGERRRLPVGLDAAAALVGRAVGTTAVAVRVGAAAGGNGDRVDGDRPAVLARALGGVRWQRAGRRAGRRRRRGDRSTAVKPRVRRSVATVGVARSGASRLPGREQAASAFVAEAPAPVWVAVRVGAPSRRDAVVCPAGHAGAARRRRRGRRRRDGPGGRRRRRRARHGCNVAVGDEGEDARAVGGERATHAARLLLGEVGQAGVVRVVHVVVDRLGVPARVLARAVVDRTVLWVGVADRISRHGATLVAARGRLRRTAARVATLAVGVESVVKPEVMP